MSLTRTLVLGFIAGATIVLGLPVGRLKSPAARLRTLLNALAVGVLFFLVIDVFSHAYAPIQAQLESLHHHHGGSVAQAVGDIALLVGGAAVGLLSLALYQQWTRHRRASARPDDAAGDFVPSPSHLSMMIAIGIGLHNFGEGLAIGSSARLGAIGLSTVLVIGFGLHNATEGFGIVSPLAGAAHRPTWGFLGLVALIGGGPTTLGTLAGWFWSNSTVSILFLSLAGGSIIFVICQLLYVASKSANPTTVYVGVAIGLIAGFLTDVVVTTAGG
ncbi:MAG: ZIP family metal transporter [Acidimicrobiales bacterium]